MAVYDGKDAMASLIGGKLCGTTVPQPIVATGNEVFVKFHSDPFVVGSGFQFQVDAGEYFNI